MANVTFGPLLTVGELAAIAGGRVGWSGDDSVTRFDRVLAAFGYEGVATGAGLSNMCPSAADGVSLGRVLADVATAERAPWWVDVEGRARFAPRSDYWGRPAAAAIGAGQLGAGIGFDLSDSGRRTVVNARRPGGPAVHRRAAGEAEAAGEVGGGVLLLRVDSQPQVESLAAEAVAPVWSEPRLRTSTLTVDLVRSAALVDAAALLGVDVGAVVEVDGLPSSAPAGARRWSVRRVTDRLSTSSWVRRFDVEAAGDPLAVFRVGVDLLDGPAVVGW